MTDWDRWHRLDAQLIRLRERVEKLEHQVTHPHPHGAIVLTGAEADAWRAVKAALCKGAM